MPISLATSEFEYYHFAMLRDAYFRRNAFIINDQFTLRKQERFKFRNFSNCYASFYLFLISHGTANAQMTVKGYGNEEERTIVPRQLFAPYRMRIFDDVKDLENSYLFNKSDTDLSDTVLHAGL